MMDTRVRELRSDIEATREEFAGLIAELQRRGRDATDVKLQARRHPRIAGGLVVVVVGAVILLVARRRRRRERLREPEHRRQALDQALARMIEQPKKAADTRNALMSLALAAGTAFVSTLARRAAQNAAATAWRQGDGRRQREGARATAKAA